MSIFGSFGVFENEHGDYPAPIIYQGSHVLPADDDPRGGRLCLGEIPSFITRDGHDMDLEDEAPRPWLRFSVDPDIRTYEGDPTTVVLDASQVRALIYELGRWFFPPGPDTCRRCEHCDGLGVRP